MKQKPGLLLISLAYLAFVSLGLPDGLLGVAWPSIRAHFSISLADLGPLLVMFTTGYLLSSVTSGRLLSRINIGALLVLSCLATSAGMLGYALAPSWSLMVALGLLSGLGAGAIDAGLNTYAATHFSAPSVNWLHACYGAGATIGPVIMTSVLEANLPWQWGYGIVGVAQLGLAVSFGLTRKRWQNGSAAQETPARGTSAAAGGSTLRLPIVWLSITAFFLYTGLEAAAGIWVYSLFTEARAMSPTTAGMWVSAFWGGLTAGRLISGFVVGFVPIHRLLRFAMIGVALGAALIWLNITSLLSSLGLTLMGVALAPIFPLLIATTPGRLGDAHTANGIGFQVAAAALGQSLLPGLVGVMARHLGLETVGPVLLSAAILLLALYETLTATSLKNAQASGAGFMDSAQARRRAS